MEIPRRLDHVKNRGWRESERLGGVGVCMYL
jgi:hypothetical protein